MPSNIVTCVVHGCLNTQIGDAMVLLDWGQNCVVVSSDVPVLVFEEEENEMKRKTALDKLAAGAANPTIVPLPCHMGGITPLI